MAEPIGRLKLAATAPETDYGSKFLDIFGDVVKSATGTKTPTAPAPPPVVAPVPEKKPVWPWIVGGIGIVAVVAIGYMIAKK